MIRPVTLQDDFVPLAELLNRAFAPVAEAFGLTRENSPNHNAFITAVELKAQLTGNREFYLWTEQELPAGLSRSNGRHPLPAPSTSRR